MQILTSPSSSRLQPLSELPRDLDVSEDMFTSLLEDGLSLNGELKVSHHNSTYLLSVNVRVFKPTAVSFECKNTISSVASRRPYPCDSDTLLALIAQLYLLPLAKLFSCRLAIYSCCRIRNSTTSSLGIAK